MSSPRLLGQCARSVQKLSNRSLTGYRSLQASRPQLHAQLQRRTYAEKPQPADDPSFESIVDRPAALVRKKQRHGWGLAFLAIMPLTAFALGTWQVQRLDWKTKLISRSEDRLVRPPLPLPSRIDPDAIQEFDYRRVHATGRLRNDQEMLIGPRVHEGKDGYLVITPLEREGASTVLVNRGWIAKDKRDQRSRDQAEGVPQGNVTIKGLLREPFKKNYFTPDNKPEKGEWYFPDVAQMAQVTGAQPVWVEETSDSNLLEEYRREAAGIPIGRVAAVNLRNNHTQYIVTWYSLAAATTIMLYMVAKKPPSGLTQRVRRSNEWA